MAKTVKKKSGDPVRSFRMSDEVYDVLVKIAAADNRRVGNALEELILRNRVGGDTRK